MKLLKKFALPLLLLSTLVLGVIASQLIISAPNDYQQGMAAKIMYIHVPCAWLAVGFFAAMGLNSAAFLVWRNVKFYLTASILAPIGATFSAITLISGAIWGKPTWGTWWVWDARLTSMLVLFLLYVGYILINTPYHYNLNRARISSALALIGLINVPLIKMSVYLWHSLHQTSSIFTPSGVAIHPAMLKPLIYSTVCLCCYSLYVYLLQYQRLKLTRKSVRHEIQNAR